MTKDGMTEAKMREELANKLNEMGVAQKFEQQIDSDISVSIDEKVNIPYKIWLEPRDGLSNPRLQIRHYEQDIVFYTESDIYGESDLNLYNTSDSHLQVPLCIVEVKKSGMTTETTLAYSAKAQEIKSVFPFSHYIVVTGNERKRKWEFHGQEFDAIRSLGGQSPDEWRIDEIEETLLNQFEIVSNKIERFESR